MPDIDDEDWQLRLTYVPKGTHLSDSTKSPGRERDLLREDGSNKILGPTESVPVELEDVLGLPGHQLEPARTREQQLTPGQQAAKEVIGDVVNVVLYDVVVPVMREVVVPAIQRKLSDLREVRRAKKAARVTPGAVESSLAPRAEPDDIEADIRKDVDVHNLPVSMGSNEFRERLLLAVAAEQYAAAQRKLLASVRIDDPDLDPQLARAIQLVLEGEHVSLDEQALAVLAAFLQGTSFGEEVVPLQLDSTQPRETRVPLEGHPQD